MQDYKFATVIVADADVAQARIDLGDGMFSVPLSPTGAEPVTHWMSSGAFYKDQLAFIVTSASWSAYLSLTQDWASIIASQGLQMIVDPVDSTVE